jgi:hypothetical protein
MPGLVGYIQYREEQKEIRALFEKWSGDSRQLAWKTRKIK